MIDETIPLTDIRLTTPRLVLRPFILDDAAAVQRLAGAREIAAGTLNIPHPYTDGIAEGWIITHAESWGQRRDLNLAVNLAPAGPLIGAIGLILNPADSNAELGYWIGVPYWGQGYATEAVGAMLRFAFDTLELHRVHARHFPWNEASGRVLLKAGMTREGLCREHVRKGTRFEDVVCYGILRSDSVNIS